MSFNGMPNGTSINPVRVTFPAREKVLVPLLVAEPNLAYQSPPRCITVAASAQVPTLLILLGLPHKPELAGKGGRERGIPLLPSMETIKAVSSPQTKAPAPSFISMSKLKPEPRIFSPSKLYSLICLRACSNLLTASGYSARQ